MINLVLAQTIPIVVFVSAVAWLRRQRRVRSERPPVTSKLLRSPGHSLMLREKELSEQLFESMAMALVASVGCGIVLQYLQTPNPWTNLALTLPLASLCAFLTLRGFRRVTMEQRIRLGRLGEQLVGEELEPLRVEGYRIFHDFPGGPNWNIDHIAIGPGGVFVFETKTRSKRRSDSKQPDHEVLFENDILTFSWGTDSKAATQARCCAKSLAKFLAGSTAETVEVVPFVVLPGWYVTVKDRNDVRVVSGKGLAKVIRGFRPILTPERVQQIAFQVEQKCRDVEF